MAPPSGSELSSPRCGEALVLSLDCPNGSESGPVGGDGSWKLEREPDWPVTPGSWKVEAPCGGGGCGTPGCDLEAGHIGLCSCAVIRRKRVCGA